MLTPRLPRMDWMFGCCSGGNSDPTGGEFQVQLTSDISGAKLPRNTLLHEDSFDITFTPRSGVAATPRQRELKHQLELPSLNVYPLPPTSTAEDSEEERRTKLLDMYQEFALDLVRGTYLTQLTSNRDYSDIHCQLMEDLVTLKLDQSNGRIIEFPLTNVSKVYRIVKNEDKWYAAGTSTVDPPSGEQIVVVEFMRRKLAFVFKELAMSQRFLISMELLIRRAQQKQAKQALRSLTPTFPPSQADKAQLGQCPTPRQVHDALTRPMR